MRNRQYYMAHDCPHCGDKDAQGKWGGARMSSTEWPHRFTCCSDACGVAFGEKYKELEKTKKGRKELADLWHKFQSQSDARLSGEPYPGYDAEMQLKALGRGGY